MNEQNDTVLLNRYQILGELGRGGMGVVHRCLDTVAGIEVAVKSLSPEFSNEAVEMEGVRENFKLVEKLHHPNIADIKTLEKDAQGNCHLVMECVDGKNLREWLREKHADGTLTSKDVLSVLRQTADALDYAHRQKIIHRDINPGNIMVTPDGTVKVLDFGIAKKINPAASRASQPEDYITGTGPYMAPEQWRGESQDAKTDQYALAVVAYEMFAGRVPFEDNQDAEALSRIVLNTLPEPVQGFSTTAWNALARALSKNSAERFASCANFTKTLESGNPQIEDKRSKIPMEGERPNKQPATSRHRTFRLPGAFPGKKTTTQIPASSPSPPSFIFLLLRPKIIAIFAGIILLGFSIPVVWFILKQPDDKITFLKTDPVYMSPDGSASVMVFTGSTGNYPSFKLSDNNFIARVAGEAEKNTNWTIEFTATCLSTNSPGRSCEVEINDGGTIQTFLVIQRPHLLPNPELALSIVMDDFKDIINFDIYINLPRIDPSTVESAVPVRANIVCVYDMKPPKVLDLERLAGVDRSIEARRRYIKEYCHGNIFNEHENVVNNALRWFKKNQNRDGSWPRCKPAMTGFALLCFLAHGETGESDEFGHTVVKAIEYLIYSYRNNRWDNSDGDEYAFPIALFALCEAYGMIGNPNIRPVAESALKRLIDGQNRSGGWDYNMRQSDRDDTSYMAWCAQAIKAAQMAGMFSNDREWKAKLDRASKLSINGFIKNSGQNGGFGYTESGNTGFNSLGVLCMQLHGAANTPQARNTLTLMDNWVPGWFATEAQWRNSGMPGSIIYGYTMCPQYYYYYATMAKFFEPKRQFTTPSGSRRVENSIRWQTWEKGMTPSYFNAQKIIRNAYPDHMGVMRDIGWWENIDQHTDNRGGLPVMDTCLVLLQLMTPYRYSNSAINAAVRIDYNIREAVATDKDDVRLDIGNL